MNGGEKKKTKQKQKNKKTTNKKNKTKKKTNNNKKTHIKSRQCLSKFNFRQNAISISNYMKQAKKNQKTKKNKK